MRIQYGLQRTASNQSLLKVMNQCFRSLAPAGGGSRKAGGGGHVRFDKEITADMAGFDCAILVDGHIHGNQFAARRFAFPMSHVHATSIRVLGSPP